ncbi:zinc finger CCCH domain-containing protein 37 [Citrus sinensis]|nr:zinc finger CCCH domain-containing protein 37 [Citrus sinensis]
MVIAQAMELEEEVGPLNHRQLSPASTHRVHWQTLTIYQSRLFVTTLITPFTIHFGTRAICPPRLSNLGPLASIPLTTSNDPPKVPVIASSESLPERPGEPDCPYFLKTQRCKFGSKCKFNHPKDKLIGSSDSGNGDVSALPERPSEPPCAFYLKNGTCKFGATCKFDHPKDFQLPSVGQENGIGEQNESVIKTDETTGLLNPGMSLFSHAPAMLHNSKGLPIRPGELDCPFYLKTGSCKYGSTCRYNHPERTAINPPAAAIVHPLITSPAASLGISVVSPAASLYQTIDPRLAQATLGVSPSLYPQRPGQMECDYYMKTGVCKFGEKCKFHHPIDRSAAKTPSQETVKLTLAGLPRREV